MEKIQAFKLSNGEIVTNEKEAIEKEAQLNFLSQVSQFADDHGFYEGKSQIYEAITENVDDLYEILKTYKESK